MEFAARVRITKPLNIRQGGPFRSAIIARREEVGAELSVVARVQGERVKDNALWYVEAGTGLYFWGGGAEVAALQPAPPRAPGLFVPPKVQAELAWVRDCRLGDKGPEVKRVQEWLNFHQHACAVDSDFGPATLRAVREYQADLGLSADGVVNQALFAQLSSPLRQALQAPPPPANAASLGAWVRCVAEQHLAQRPLELGGPNRGPWVRVYMDGVEGDAAYWCAGFVTFVMKQASYLSGLPMPVAGTVGCDELSAQARHAGCFISGAELMRSGPPAMGDPRAWIFLSVSASNASDWVHTGFACDFDLGSFKSIEGNADSAGSRNGYEVCSRSRGLHLRDFIRLE